jgi:hypothetical protein
MAMPVTTLHDVLDLELEQAYVALAAAKEAQQRKDTPYHRSLVVEAYDNIDAILDLLNETKPDAVVDQATR